MMVTPRAAGAACWSWSQPGERVQGAAGEQNYTGLLYSYFNNSNRNGLQSSATSAAVSLLPISKEQDTLLTEGRAGSEQSPLHRVLRAVPTANSSPAV